MTDLAPLLWPTQERMNSPLENRKVRLRGLGGPAMCGIPRTCASAAGGLPDQMRNRHHSLRGGGLRVT